MNTTCKHFFRTSTNIEKAIRFASRDKAFGAMVYYEAVRLAGGKGFDDSLRVAEYLAGDIKTKMYYVEIADGDSVQWLAHPCAHA